jgi:hypothetical protein
MNHRAMDTDCAGRKIKVDDVVSVSRGLRDLKAHLEFRRAFRKVSGQLRTVVGWDSIGGAWIRISSYEVLTIEPRLLKVIRRGVHRHNGNVLTPNIPSMRLPLGAREVRRWAHRDH